MTVQEITDGVQQIIMDIIAKNSKILPTITEM